MAGVAALPVAVRLCGHTDPIVAERAAQTVEVLAAIALQQKNDPAAIRDMVIPALADACDGSNPTNAACVALRTLSALCDDRLLAA